MTSLEALDRIKNFDKTRNRSAVEYLLEQEITDTCFEIIEKSLKALEILKDTCKLKVYKNKLGQCFLEGTDILYAISQEEYDLLKEILNGN